MTKFFSTIAVVTCVLGTVIPAIAQAEENENHRPRSIHGEFTMGFLVGGRRYEDENFSYVSGGGDIEGVQALVQPFQGAPYDSVFGAGLRYDVRLVVSYVRMTAGVDFPFPMFQTRDTERTITIDGTAHQVTVQDIRPYELRFGIGGEYPVSIVAPFIDLLGTVNWVKTSLSIDGSTVEYDASSFGFSIRGGVRVHLRNWFFIAASGEIGLVGNVFWNAELSVGFTTG